MSTGDRFINERKGAWQRLEDLLALLDSMTLRRLHREEVRELGRIYRRTSSDLAIARAECRDPRLVNYLNSLVIRAHGRTHRPDARAGGAPHPSPPPRPAASPAPTPARAATASASSSRATSRRPSAARGASRRSPSP